MKYLVTSGCSFSAEDHTWPEHLADRLQVEKHYRLGKGSAGNDYISRSIIRQVYELIELGIKPSDLVVVVMWSGQDRFSTYFTNTELEERHSWLVPYHSQTNPMIWPQEDSEGSWFLCNAGFNNKFSDTYYKKYYNQTNIAYKTFEAVLLTQMFLQNNNIKYVFAEYKRKIFSYPESSNIHFKHYESLIDWSKFVKYPCHDWCQKKMPDDFLTPGDDHPTEKQHKAYVERILYPFVKDLK